jgi:hypothetical protein
MLHIVEKPRFKEVANGTKKKRDITPCFNITSSSHDARAPPRAGSVRAREIGKLARKHRNRYSLQQVYEIVRDIWQIERDAMTTKRKRERMKEEKKKKEAMK